MRFVVRLHGSLSGRERSPRHGGCASEFWPRGDVVVWWVGGGWFDVGCYHQNLVRIPPSLKAVVSFARDVLGIPKCTSEEFDPTGRIPETFTGHTQRSRPSPRQWQKCLIAAPPGQKFLNRFHRCKPTITSLGPYRLLVMKMCGISMINFGLT